MAGKYAGGIRQDEEHFLDAAEELAQGAAGEVRAADAVQQESVAIKEEALAEREFVGRFRSGVADRLDAGVVAARHGEGLK